MTPPRILFVCLGNICRSPLAEGIFVRDAARAGIEIEVDSAGTGDWHVGQLPDPRARRVGEALGCRMDMRARQVRSRDFREFDLIVGMDRTNVRDLCAWSGADPARVRLARSFEPGANDLDVPDPYYGGIEDFEEVAAMLEAVSPALLNHVRRSSEPPRII
jgi:protein-tyrosine phosphatase